MQIHELNSYNGELDSGAYVAIDNGSDTGKVSVTGLLADTNADILELDTFLNARIDNIIAGGAAPSESEIVDARFGADGVTYASLGDAIRDQVTDVKTDVKSEINELLDVSTRTVTITDSSIMTSGYVSTNGTIHASSSYVYTEKIAVAEGDIIHAYVYGVQKSIRFICAYHNDTAISAKGAENVESYTVPSGVNYVRLSIAYASTWKYTYTITRNEQYSQRLANITVNKINSNSTNGNFLESCKQSLKKNVCVSYFANFNEFTSLLIGFTKGTSSADYIDRFEITSTNIILHRVGKTDITWTHGLTMQNFISVRISFDFTQHFIINVETNGGAFTRDNYVLLGSRYMPFAILTATGSANNKLSMTCKDFKRNILLFGDSYISNSASRWIYYLGDSIDQLCLNGYAGESSESAVNDFDKVIQLASPNYIVWCLGMNDGSDADDATPNGTWLSSIQHIISACEENGIIPILATIPSVPSINNRAKSAWVRSSGYKYIDFASAVNSDNSGNWYSGMLSSDNVHPTEQGAKTLYARAITDFPQLLVTSD